MEIRPKSEEYISRKEDQIHLGHSEPKGPGWRVSRERPPKRLGPWTDIPGNSGCTDLPSKGSREPDLPTGDWPDRHFLLQGVTSRRQLCTCPAAPFSTARPLPRFCWLSHLQGLRSAGAEATWGQSQGSWCSGLHHSAKLCCSQQRPASNNSRDDSRRGHNQIAYLKSDYVLCPQRWRSSIQ